MNLKFKKLKMGIKRYISTNVLFLTFVITALLNEWLIRAFTVKNYFAIRPIIADLAVILLIGAFGYFFKPKNQFRYFFTVSILFTFICIVNSMYYTNYLSYASVSLFATSFQIIDVGDAVVENVMEIKDFSYIWQLLIMLYVHSVLKKKNYYEEVSKTEVAKKRVAYTLIASMLFASLFTATISAQEVGRLSKPWNKEYIVAKFGIYTYQVNDIFANLKPKINPLFGYDNKAKEYRDYYATKKEEPKTNDYTDIFKGKNIIAIHAESIQQFTMDISLNGQEITPNLNKLAKEGIYFSNFYAQESVGTSSDSEFTFNTSLMPSTSGTVFINYWDREYVSIPKLLEEQNYYSFSMHGNNGSFWNRNIMHKKLGYDHFYYYDKDFIIDETIGLGLTDKSFFRQAVPKIKEVSETNTNFYGTMIMLTNHTPFSYINSVSDYEVDYKYQAYNSITGEYEMVSAPFMEGTKLGNYFKSVHYADEAIGQFISDLDTNGLLENTVIVIYGDHDAKIKKSEYERYYNYDPYTDTVLDQSSPDYYEMTDYTYELNRNVPLIIWTKNKEFNVEVTKVMGMYDILPTLGNMFDFDSKYALGHDIFSTVENVVIFPDGDWLTDKMYYNSQTEEGILLNIDATVSIDYINKYCLQAEQAISVSNAIITYDLIKKEGLE